MAGEVLRARGDARRLHAPDGRGDVARGHLRIGAERTDADYRIARIEVDVGNRGEIDRDTGTPQPVPDRGVHRFSGGRVVERTERGGTGSRAADPRVEPRHVAALLVERHNDITPGGIAKRPRQRRDSRAVADIRPEQHDAAEAVGQSLSEPRGRYRPGESGQQAAACEPSDIGQGARSASQMD